MTAATDLDDLRVIQPDELARLLGVSVEALRGMRQRGTAPPHILVGRRVMYRVRDVRDWLDSRTD